MPNSTIEYSLKFQAWYCTFLVSSAQILCSKSSEPFDCSDFILFVPSLEVPKVLFCDFQGWQPAPYYIKFTCIQQAIMLSHLLFLTKTFYICTAIFLIYICLDFVCICLVWKPWTGFRFQRKVLCQGTWLASSIPPH